MRSLLRSPLSALTCLLLPAATFAQGALTPPGAPAPTMKSLAELDASLAALTAKAEARIPLSAATAPGDAISTFIINTPGSYFLTGNVTGELGKNGIQINVANVTLDLNGYALVTGTTSGAGVLCQSNLRQIAVLNGAIRGAWSNGIAFSNTTLATVRDVTVSNTSSTAISSLVASILVENCQVAECGGGILTSTDNGIVRGCSVSFINRAVSGAIYGICAGVVADCSVNGVSNFDADGTAYGVFARTVTNTRVSAVTALTAMLISSQTVAGCHVNNGTVTPNGTLYGINAREVSHCHVAQINATGTSATVGILAPVVSDCIVERVTNSTSSFVYGIRGGATSTTTGGSTETAVISRCTVSGSSTHGITVIGQGTVEGNRVGHCTGTGIQISNGTVRSNFTHNCALGISVAGGFVTGNVSQTDTTAFNFGANVRAGTTLTTGGIGAFDVNANLDL